MIDDDIGLYYSDDDSVCIGLTFHHLGEGGEEKTDYDNTRFNEVATQSTNSTDSGVECPRVITIDPNLIERETDSGCDDVHMDLTSFLASDRAQPDRATFAYSSNVSVAKKKLLGGVSGQSVGFLSARSMDVLNGKLEGCNISDTDNSRVYTKGRTSPEGITCDVKEEKKGEREEEKKGEREEEKKMSREEEKKTSREEEKRTSREEERKRSREEEKKTSREEERRISREEDRKDSQDRKEDREEGKREDRKEGRREERKRRCNKVPSDDASSNGSDRIALLARCASSRGSGSYENVPSYENLPKRNPVYVNCKPPKFLTETPRIADMSVVEPRTAVRSTVQYKQRGHKDHGGVRREEGMKKREGVKREGVRRDFYNESVEYNTPVRRNYIANPRKLSPHHYEKIDSPNNTLSPGEVPSNLIESPATSVFNPGYMQGRVTGNRCLGRQPVYLGQSKYSARQAFRDRYTPNHAVSTPNLVPVHVAPTHLATRERYDTSIRPASNIQHASTYLLATPSNLLVNHSNHVATPSNHVVNHSNHVATPNNNMVNHSNHVATPSNHVVNHSNHLATPSNHLVIPSNNRERYTSRDKMMYLDNPIYGISEADQCESGEFYKCYRCHTAMDKEEKFRGEMENVYCSRCRNTVRFKGSAAGKKTRIADEEYKTPSPTSKYRPGTPYHLPHTSVNVDMPVEESCYDSSGDEMSLDGSTSPELQQKGVVLLQATNEDINSLRNVEDKILELRFVDSGLTEEILHLLSLLCKEKNIHRIMLDDCEVEDWVVFCNVIRQTNITHLSINKSKVGDDGSVRISHLLNAAPSLCSLELTKCKIKCAGIAALGVALMQNKTLLNLDLSGNDFKKNGAVLFFRALKSGNSTLQRLSLHHTCVGKTDVVLMIAALLLRNNGLSALHLGYTDMTDDGVGLIAESLAHNTTLNFLGLAGNELSDASAHEMAVTLADSNTIKSVDFSDNVLSARGLNVLIQSVTVRKSVSQLLLSSNSVTEGENEDLRRLTEDLAMCDVVVI